MPVTLKGTWILQWKEKSKLGLPTREAVHLGWQSQEDTHTANTAAIEGEKLARPTRAQHSSAP